MNVSGMTARWHDDGWMEIASAAQHDNTSSQQAKHSQQLPNHQRKLPEVMKQHQEEAKALQSMGNPILQPFGSRGALGTLLRWENLAENTGVNRAHGFTKSVKSPLDKTKHL